MPPPHPAPPLRPHPSVSYPLSTPLFHSLSPFSLFLPSYASPFVRLAPLHYFIRFFFFGLTVKLSNPRMAIPLDRTESEQRAQGRWSSLRHTSRVDVGDIRCRIHTAPRPFELYGPISNFVTENLSRAACGFSVPYRGERPGFYGHPAAVVRCTLRR